MMGEENKRVNLSNATLDTDYVQAAMTHITTTMVTARSQSLRGQKLPTPLPFCAFDGVDDPCCNVRVSHRRSAPLPAVPSLA